MYPLLTVATTLVPSADEAISTRAREPDEFDCVLQVAPESVEV